MENEKRIDELQAKLEELYTERKNIESAIFKFEEKHDIRQIPETDSRYKNIHYLYERYSILDIEIQKIKDEIQHLKDSQTNSSLHKKEEELVSLEREEKIITDAETLINIKTSKEGPDIGAN